MIDDFFLSHPRKNIKSLFNKKIKFAIVSLMFLFFMKMTWRRFIFHILSNCVMFSIFCEMGWVNIEIGVMDGEIFNNPLLTKRKFVDFGKYWLWQNCKKSFTIVRKGLGRARMVFFKYGSRTIFYQKYFTSLSIKKYRKTGIPCIENKTQYKT